MTDLSKNIEALREKKAVIEMGGGEAAIEKQVAMGKLTARERILALLDKNSFHEYDMFVKHDGRDFGMEKKVLPGDGVVTGTGTIFGAPVCIYAQDFTVAGGSLGLQHARKITKIMDHALKMNVRSSESMTRVAHVSKKVLVLWLVMVKYSIAIRSPRA